MKKLMLAAAIVCAAIIAQASTVSWSISGIKDIKGAELDATSQFSTYTLTVEFFSDAMDSLSKTTYTQTSDAFDGDLGEFGGQWKSAETETTYYAQAILIDKDNNTLTSEIASFTTSKTSTYSINFGTGSKFTTGGTKFTSDWVAAPEPTSGLLILLGMAGLALRRRRA